MVASACSAPVDGPPARLVVGTSDTLIVSNLRPFQIPARVLDSSGHALQMTGVRYEWTAGDSIPISATGIVTCTRNADATLRASVGVLVATALLQCRPVRTVHIAGPMQFTLGDSAQAIPVEALGIDSSRVEMFAASAEIMDSSIAGLDGMLIRPRKPGATLASVRVGDRSAAVGVHVYERVNTLDGLRPEQTFVAVPLRLTSGEVRRWRLPAGIWMLTMLPYEDEARGLRLRIEGANCLPAPITPRRYVCLAKDQASVIVYHPSIKPAPHLAGELLLRRVSDR